MCFAVCGGHVKEKTLPKRTVLMGIFFLVPLMNSCSVLLQTSVQSSVPSHHGLIPFSHIIGGLDLFSLNDLLHWCTNYTFPYSIYQQVITITIILPSCHMFRTRSGFKFLFNYMNYKPHSKRMVQGLAGCYKQIHVLVLLCNKVYATFNCSLHMYAPTLFTKAF